MASAHLLAAAGGDGMLEVDINPNPLREALVSPYPMLADGHFPIPEGPGLDVAPDQSVIVEYLCAHYETSDP